MDEAKQQQFWAACFRGQISKVESLLRARNPKINVNYFLQSNGWTPMHVACDRGFVSILEALLEHNPDLTIKDNSGNTAIDLLNGKTGENYTKIQHLLAGPGHAIEMNKKMEDQIQKWKDEKEKWELFKLQLEHEKTKFAQECEERKQQINEKKKIRRRSETSERSSSKL